MPTTASVRLTMSMTAMNRTRIEKSRKEFMPALVVAGRDGPGDRCSVDGYRPPPARIEPSLSAADVTPPRRLSLRPRLSLASRLLCHLLDRREQVLQHRPPALMNLRGHEHARIECELLSGRRTGERRRVESDDRAIAKRRGLPLLLLLLWIGRVRADE